MRGKGSKTRQDTYHPCVQAYHQGTCACTSCDMCCMLLHLSVTNLGYLNGIGNLNAAYGLTQHSQDSLTAVPLKDGDKTPSVYLKPPISHASQHG